MQPVTRRVDCHWSRRVICPGRRGASVVLSAILLPLTPHAAALADDEESVVTAASTPPPVTTASEPIAAPVPIDRLGWHFPDPDALRPILQQSIEKAKQAKDNAQVRSLERQAERIEAMRKPRQTSLTLEEALRRALANNFSIEVQRYNPAIETTRIVEAEAAFDAIMFSDFTKNKVNRPTGSQLAAQDSDFWDWRTGVRKVLPSGMTVSGSYGLQRTETSLSFQTINPEYFSDFAFEMRQPFLRGFGLDYNRSLILIAQNDRRVSEFALEREVRDVLREVEERYWRLLQARRNLAITARLLSDFEVIHEYVVSRKDFDMTPVQINATEANLKQSRAEFVEVRASVWDTQDQLLQVLNDPELNLAEDVEIIPTSFPGLVRFDVDRVAEVKTALEKRPEIREQKTRIDNARIVVGRMKNEELPRFDVTFRYTIDGLGGNQDRSLDQALEHDFVEYFVGLQFEMPIGNRGPRAASTRARLQHLQAAAALKDIFEQIILDVNLAVRRMSTSYDQITPSFESAEAREREVESIVARAERKDLNTLNSELGARQSLAGARRAMLAAMVDYNIAIIDLERAKGTLLEYNNVVVPMSGMNDAK